MIQTLKCLPKTYLETSKVVCPGLKSMSTTSVKLSNCLTVISLIISGSIVEIHGVTPIKETQWHLQISCLKWQKNYISMTHLWFFPCISHYLQCSFTDRGKQNSWKVISIFILWEEKICLKSDRLFLSSKLLNWHCLGQLTVYSQYLYWNFFWTS